MQIRVRSIPFEVQIFEGLGAASGLIRCDGDALLLEFETKDTVFGVIKSRVKQVRLPLVNIDWILLKKGWFSTSLQIQASTLNGMEDVPGSEKGLAKLSLARRYRLAAQQFVDDVMERLEAQVHNGSVS